LQAIEEAVRGGHPVILFPEGTTHSNVQTLQFRRGGFQLAAQNGFRIVPVAINFRFAADNWTGGETFLPHFLRRFGEPHLEVRMAYGPVLSDPDADLLLEKCTGWINRKLSKWQTEGWNQ
jgi:1-acyl-sn-glycerol-3-phosphate acyltransferase